MSYTPTLWQTGDIITAQKLNNIENGIVNAGGGELFLITFTFHDGDPSYYTADKTLEEVSEAYRQGKWIIACLDDVDNIYQLSSHYGEGSEEYFNFIRSYGEIVSPMDDYANFRFDQSEFSLSSDGIYAHEFGITINSVTLDYEEITNPQSNPD